MIVQYGWLITKLIFNSIITLSLGLLLYILTASWFDSAIIGSGDIRVAVGFNLVIAFFFFAHMYFFVDSVRRSLESIEYLHLRQDHEKVILSLLRGD